MKPTAQVGIYDYGKNALENIIHHWGYTLKFGPREGQIFT